MLLKVLFYFGAKPKCSTCTYLKRKQLKLQLIMTPY